MRSMTAPDDDKTNDLARDIGFAIWRSPLRVKGKEAQRIDMCVMIAKNVVTYLRRSLWRFEKLPPYETHGPSGMKPGQEDKKSFKSRDSIAFYAQ